MTPDASNARRGWRTLLVHLDASARCAARVDLALAWAAEQGGAVIGLASIGSPDVLLAMRADMPDALEVVALSAERLRQQAQAAAARCEARARAAGVPCTTRVVATDDVGDALARQAWTADVVLVGQRDFQARVEGVPDDLPQQAILRSGRPVVVVPTVGECVAVPDTVLVAWRSGREASVAVRDALPLLARARRVVLIEVTRDGAAPPSASLHDASARGGATNIGGTAADALDWLARHGVHATLARTAARGEEAIGDALLAEAAAVGADLLVMGGYGHARLREWVLGGVTRHVLANMTLPVLFSH